MKAIESLRFASGDEDIRSQLYDEFGDALHEDFKIIKGDLEKRIIEWGSDNGDDEDENPSNNALPESMRKKLLNPETWYRDEKLYEVALKLREELGSELFEDYNTFQETVKETIKNTEIKISASDLKIILRTVSWREETAPPVISKIHKNTKIKPDPLYGRYKHKEESESVVVEYEPDTELRDTEQVPLLEEGGIEAFIKREVLPYAPDAWIKREATKIGYEISFTRHFYKPVPLRTLEEIRTDIIAVEKEAEGLLEGILNIG